MSVAQGDITTSLEQLLALFSKYTYAPTPLPGSARHARGSSSSGSLAGAGRQADTSAASAAPGLGIDELAAALERSVQQLRALYAGPGACGAWGMGLDWAGWPGPASGL